MFKQKYSNLWAIIVSVGFVWAGITPLSVTCFASEGEDYKNNLSSSLPAFTTSNPLKFSLLWFTNDSNPMYDHWSRGIRSLVLKSMNKVPVIHSCGGIDYACVTLGIEKGTWLEPELAGRIGEVIEAQRVAWGRIKRINDQWQVSLCVVNTTTGKSADPLVVTSSNWFVIRDQLLAGLLNQWGISITPKEQEVMTHRETDSLEALEFYHKATFREDSFADVEKSLRKALKLDPNYVQAWISLAGQQCNQGDYDQGWSTLQHALKLEPDSARAHWLAGSILSHQKKYSEAEQTLQRALVLEPRLKRSRYALAQVYAKQKLWDQAIMHTQMALEQTPLEPSYHANQGMFYASQGDRDRAQFHLQEARRLTAHRDLVDFNTEMALFKAYLLLKEYPLAVNHGERFIDLAKKKGWGQKWIASYERLLKLAKKQRITVEVQASVPQTYTEASLQQRLSNSLTPEERNLLVYPLTSTPAMEEYAQTVADALPETHTEMDLAQALFDAVMQRKGDRGGEMDLTADQVFAVWDDPNASLDCEAYAKIYIAFARAVGLQAFLVHVDRDCYGKLIDHDCAIVFTNLKTVLVDPAYYWFGPGHQEFIVLDDVQAIAHHLCQHGPKQNAIDRCRVATKLHPNYVWVQLRLASAFWSAQQKAEAQKAIELAEQLEPNRWNTLLMRAVMSSHEQDWEKTQEWLDQTLDVNPDSFYGHYLQGITWQTQGDFDKARESYRCCLQCNPLSSVSETARRQITKIDEHDDLGPIQKMLNTVRLKKEVMRGR